MDVSNVRHTNGHETASLDSGGKKKSFGRLCQRFAEKTSMQGVPYINSAKLCRAKVIWAILLVAALAAMTYHLIFLCDQFFRYPKITKISLGFDELVLPAITICNVNPFMKSYVDKVSKKLQKLINSVDPKQLNFTAKPDFDTDFEDFDYADYMDNDAHTLYRNFKGLGPQHKFSQLKRTFFELFSRESRIVRRRIGHKLVNMLLSCSFKGTKCDPRNFTLFQTKEYGNCYTLQSPFFVVDSPGPSGGLQLILMLENLEYLRGITEGYGARIVIHPQGTVPFPHDQGFYISTATETHVAIRLLKITRKGLPHGNCSSGDEFESTFNLNYTRAVCNTVCAHNLLRSRCKCYTSDMEELRTASNKRKDYKICRTKKDVHCQAKVANEIRKRSNACFERCFDPCQESDYSKIISQRQWPTEEFTSLLVQSVCRKKSNNPSFVNHCQTLLGQDERQRSLQFLKLVLYFEDLNFESIEEREEIEFAQFASDVGGALGLWIGLSVLSIFELFQLCVELVDYGCHLCCTQKKTDAKKCHDSKNETRENKLEVQNSINEHDQNFVRPNSSDKYRDNYAQMNDNTFMEMVPGYQAAGPFYIHRGKIYTKSYKPSL